MKNAQQSVIIEMQNKIPICYHYTCWTKNIPGYGATEVSLHWWCGENINDISISWNDVAICTNYALLVYGPEFQLLSITQIKLNETDGQNMCAKWS